MFGTMTLLSLGMFLMVGVMVGHVASKVTGYDRATLYFALGIGGALAGGFGAKLAGMTFYNLLGHMLVGAAIGVILILISRRLLA